MELEVADAIVLKREAAGLSQKELSRRCQFSPSYVSALEARRIHPSFNAFARLATELKFTQSEIIFLIKTEATRITEHEQSV